MLLETKKFDQENYTSYLFLNPVNLITCYHLEEVEQTFIKMEQLLSEGYYLAGYISYETGYAFEEKFITLNSLKRLSRRHSLNYCLLPFIWLGVYKNPIIYNHQIGKFIGDNYIEKDSAFEDTLLTPNASRYAVSLKNNAQIYKVTPNIRKSTYVHALNTIKELIEQGETYQVNYTYKLRFRYFGHPLDLYTELCQKQPVAYNAYINTGDACAIISCSPELFFRKQGNRILMRPMKGTIKRGKTLFEDEQNVVFLSQDIKNRSENIMIVDLLRNDLGKVSSIGTVQPVQLFTVEKYHTVFQMTSTITSQLKTNISLLDLFRSLFPSGSVTGAPKINTMRIICHLEKEPRGVYTGSIGFISPKKDAVFNVAIRTVVLNTRNQSGELGIGSGIVYDSDPEREYEECRTKANFLTAPMHEFNLIETLLWTPESGYFLLELHKKRLADSAVYFGFQFSPIRFDQELTKFQKQLHGLSYRVRLLLSKNGIINLSAMPLEPLPEIVRVTFSKHRTNSNNIFLYHKTTQRLLYDREYNYYRNRGYYDVIFLNEKNEVTEGAISNIFIEKNKILYTPPIRCGLLNGVYRQYLFQQQKQRVIEKLLTKHDIITADAVYLTNAVRKMVQVKLVTA